MTYSLTDRGRELVPVLQALWAWAPGPRSDLANGNFIRGAQAVNLAALHAVRDAGAVGAMVCPRGDDGYPKARKLYQSIGFRPAARTVTYVA